MKLLSIRCPIWVPNQSLKIGCEVVAVKLKFEVKLARSVASAALLEIIFSAFCLLLQLLRRITDCYDQLQRPLLLVIGQTYHLHTADEEVMFCQVTHPFQSRFGETLKGVQIRRGWGEERVFYCWDMKQNRLSSIPMFWTQWRGQKKYLSWFLAAV